MRTQILFLLITLLISNSKSQNCNANNPQATHPSDLRVFHINSPCSPFKKPNTISWEDTLLQDKARFLYLSSLVKRSSVPIASGRGIVQSPTYIAKVNIGSPAQAMLVAIDTSSDVTWIPCSGCVGCVSSVVFDPSKSNSSRTLHCDAPQCKQAPNPTCNVGKSCGFNMTYGGSTIEASLTQDTLSLANDTIPSYTFGCINKATGTSLPAQGLMGLGRGPLSLISQTQNLYMSTFSYCLPNSKSSSFSGSLRLGPKYQPVRIKTTPLLKNPRRSSLYYVNLVGIRVGNKIVDIPVNALAFDPVSGAGTIFDSGTVFTRLVEPAYLAVRNEFRRRVKNANATSLGGFDTCYSGSNVVFPSVTFMFTGMNVSLPQDNLLIHSSSGSTSCLAMASAPNNVNSVLNVIASMQQQNHRVLIDLPNSRLGISRETCT
ncbi:unnamed protein product [Cochlearia groenlandica]